MLMLWIGIIAATVIVLFFILTYNRLVALKNQAENAYKQIDVQTKKRFDLVPNLVETVKGYAKHEKGVFTEVTEARSAILKAGNIKEKIKAENMLTGALKSLFAVTENYPKLEASQNFLMLQEELSGIESKIAYSRQFYNDTCMQLNQTIQMFPTNLIANLFRFGQKEYLEFEPESRKAVKVQF